MVACLSSIFWTTKQVPIPCRRSSASDRRALFDPAGLARCSRIFRGCSATRRNLGICFATFYKTGPNVGAAADERKLGKPIVTEAGLLIVPAGKNPTTGHGGSTSTSKAATKRLVKSIRLPMPSRRMAAPLLPPHKRRSLTASARPCCISSVLAMVVAWSGLQEPMGWRFLALPFDNF